MQWELNQIIDEEWVLSDILNDVVKQIVVRHSWEIIIDSVEASAADEDGEEGGGGGEEVSEVLEAEDIEELGGAEGEIS